MTDDEMKKMIIQEIEELNNIKILKHLLGILLAYSRKKETEVV